MSCVVILTLESILYEQKRKRCVLLPSSFTGAKILFSNGFTKCLWLFLYCPDSCLVPQGVILSENNA